MNNPITGFSYLDSPQKLPFVDIDFDSVLREAAAIADRIAPSTAVGLAMPKVGSSMAAPLGAGDGGATVEKMVHAIETVSYASAVTSLVSNVGQTIKTLVRGG